MDSLGEDRDGWHYWSFGGVFYARRLNSSPSVTWSAPTEKELGEKVAKYEEDGQPPWAGRVN